MLQFPTLHTFAKIIDDVQFHTLIAVCRSKCSNVIHRKVLVPLIILTTILVAIFTVNQRLLTDKSNDSVVTKFMPIVAQKLPMQSSITSSNLSDTTTNSTFVSMFLDNLTNTIKSTHTSPYLRYKNEIKEEVINGINLNDSFLGFRNTSSDHILRESLSKETILEPSSLDTDVIQDVTQVPRRNVHIAFIGDSVTRYQYIDLVYFLHAGRWVQNEDNPNPMDEHTYGSWLAFLKQTNSGLNGYENCDCFRNTGPPILKEIFDSRYYSDSIRNNFVSFVVKFGANPSQGHWEADDVFRQESNLSTVLGKPFQPALWIYNWTDLIQYHIRFLTPRPKYVILNAGLWDHDLNNITLLKGIQKQLKSAKISSIYKTTTAKNFQKISSLISTTEHDALACQVFDLCMNLSWTGYIAGKRHYKDNVHFLASVNKKFNEQLFDLIRGFESPST